MSLVSQTLKNLKGGISQQPDILRYPEQGAKQVNAFPSEVTGLIKRPPAVNVVRLGNRASLGSKPMCHLIHRDSVEQYNLVFDGATIKAVDLQSGAYVPVTATGGWNYVVTPEPQKVLRCVTIADYTFVVNTSKVCAKGSTRTPLTRDLERNALVVCVGGQFGRKFSVFINDTLAASHTTPDGSQNTDVNKVDIQFILTSLKAAFEVTYPPATSGWTCVVSQGYLHITSPATTPIRNIRVTDGYNGKLLSGFRYDVAKTTDLPVFAPIDYQVRISGEAGTDQDDYWVQFDKTRNLWVEIPAPNIVANYNTSTMPHILIRSFDTNGNAKFEFKQADWSNRAAGDDDTNPFPSFIDQTLTDVFFFRNRLGLLSGENVILSESGAYFNFFPPSVAVTADSDPIDVAVSANRVSILRYAVPFAEELLLWADHNQFVLGSDGILSPTSVKLDLTTEFEVAENARPYGLGRSVYFVSERADFSSMRRYYAVQDVSSVRDAEDVSAHVPSYIPNGIHALSGSGTENFVSVLTHGAPNLVYIYKFLYKDEQVYQQAWGHWDFGPDVKILTCQMIGSTMYMLLDTESGVYLQKLSFTSNTKDFQTEPYRLYMDNKVKYTIPTGAYDADTQVTTIYLKDMYGGVTPTFGDMYIVFTDGSTFRYAAPSAGWPSTGGRIDINGDVTTMSVFIGSAYEMTYEFSKFLIKKQAQDGSIATEDSGRLQLRRAWVNYEDTGNFTVEVNNQARTGVYQMTGKRTGVNTTVIGQVALGTGQFRFPLAGNAKRITVALSSSTPNPVSIIGAGWEGNYVRRSNGI